MWIQKDKLTAETCNEVLDWVVIDGVLWVEVNESMTPVLNEGMK